MKQILKMILITGLLSAGPAYATGLVTCDSGPEEGWQSEEQLREKLTNDGWDVRRIKVDGGCYEVYAMNEGGNRVEAYFHPVTLERVPVEDEG